MDNASYSHIARSHLLLTHLKKIVKAFEKEEVSFLLFKGFDLSLRIYGNLFARPQVDLDFIILPKDFQRAKSIVAGFSSGGPPVDLHRDILNLKRFANWEEPPLKIKGMWERKTTINLEGLTIPVLELEDLFLALVLHFVFHHQLRGQKWLTDLARLMQKGDLNWSLIQQRGRENHLTRLLEASIQEVRNTFRAGPLGRKPLFWSRWNVKPCRYLLRLSLLPKNQQWRMIREMFQDFQLGLHP